MEVSALKLSGGVGLHGRSPLLRVQSDERLVSLIRRGNDAAFEVLVGRYESRLLSFCRHMVGTKEDAEDVLQEVMAAAYNALKADDRPVNARPWLYRIARNRSLNHLRKTTAVGVDSMDIHFSDHGASTADRANQREEFRLLVGDIQRLPETQRTALVLREMDALSYDQIAEAMETTVPSVKSLLVRARMGLAEAAEAREMSCDEVRDELGEIAEGLKRKMSPPVRRHLKDCRRCDSFRVQLKETNKALAALLPLGPLVLLKKFALTQIGHHSGAAAGGAAAGGSAAAGGGALAGSGGLVSAGVGAIATKAAAGFAAAALVTAGAVAVDNKPQHHRPPAASASVAHSSHAPAATPIASTTLPTATGAVHAATPAAAIRGNALHGSGRTAAETKAASRSKALKHSKHAAAKTKTATTGTTATTAATTPTTTTATVTSTITGPATGTGTGTTGTGTTGTGTTGSTAPGRTQTQTVPTVLPPTSPGTGPATGSGTTTSGSPQPTVTIVGPPPPTTPATTPTPTPTVTAVGPPPASATAPVTAPPAGATTTTTATTTAP